MGHRSCRICNSGIPWTGLQLGGVLEASEGPQEIQGTAGGSCLTSLDRADRSDDTSRSCPSPLWRAFPHLSGLKYSPPLTGLRYSERD